jgi:y4mF family transcriptional regulator
MELNILANDIELGHEQAARFGALVRQHRKALGMNQDALALATGVGRRFIVELEGGKPTVQLGRALVVAQAVGLRVIDLLIHRATDNARQPEMPDDEES